MFAKRDYQTALKALGFKQDKTTKTSGSHFRYTHIKYKNIIAGIDDHKDTKDIRFKIHKELIKTMALVVWLECRRKDGTIDFEKAESMISPITPAMVQEILEKLKKLDYRSSSFLLALLNKKLSAEIFKSKQTINNNSILEFITN